MRNEEGSHYTSSIAGTVSFDQPNEITFHIVGKASCKLTGVSILLFVYFRFQYFGVYVCNVIILKIKYSF